MMDTADGGLLNSVRSLLSDIFLPALRASSHDWSELEGLQEASSIRQEFLNSLEGFVSVLLSAQESLKEKVRASKTFPRILGGENTMSKRVSDFFIRQS